MTQKTNLFFHPRFIAFEGLDGSGKTTQITHLANSLTKIGHNVLIVRDLGDASVPASIRKILTNPADDYAMSPASQAMLFTAARLETLKHRTLPHLEKGGIVLTDRFIASTIAMQGYASRLIQTDPDPLDLVTCLCAQITIRPKYTVFLEMTSESIANRIDKRGETRDHFENSNLNYHQEIEKHLPNAIKENTKTVLKINANTEENIIAAEIFSQIQKLIEKQETL